MATRFPFLDTFFKDAFTVKKLKDLTKFNAPQVFKFIFKGVKLMEKFCTEKLVGYSIRLVLRS